MAGLKRYFRELRIQIWGRQGSGKKPEQTVRTITVHEAVTGSNSSAKTPERIIDPCRIYDAEAKHRAEREAVKQKFDPRGFPEE